MPTPSETLKTIIGSIQEQIQQQQNLMASGHPCELGALGPLLQDMSAFLAKAAPESVKDCLQDLENVDANLAALSEAYKKQMAEAQDGMGQVSTRLRAATAYVRSNLSAPPAPLTLLPDTDDE